ncbi:MAG: hypothetical protein WBN83_00120, partial [Desulfoprunum sp.]|uniref:hypothetical protein n=1 Tax=Desulfoprunum sp. TaxID=2020866 RepID=UPI003C73518A
TETVVNPDRNPRLLPAALDLDLALNGNETAGRLPALPVGSGDRTEEMKADPNQQRNRYCTYANAHSSLQKLWIPTVLLSCCPFAAEWLFRA